MEPPSVQPVSAAPAGREPLPAQLLAELWQEAGAAEYGLGQSEAGALFTSILAAADSVSAADPGAFLRALRLGDLLLARACAAGHEGAWQHFIAHYQHQLTRAGIAITGNDSLGRELADSLYAELFGLSERDGVRRSPLDSYRGRGSLIGWLRTTLAQRHVDHHRRHHREEPLERPDGTELDLPGPAVDPAPPRQDLALLHEALRETLAKQEPETRFLVAAYYLDGRKLHEIGRLLDVHEATISRKLHRALETLHKQLFENLRGRGLSLHATQEALTADPRDLEINLRILLQESPASPFPGESSE